MADTVRPPKRITDTRYRRKVAAVQERILKRHDLQPPVVTPWTLSLVALWAAGVGVAYLLSPIPEAQLRLKVALVCSWMALVVEPVSAMVMQQPLAWTVTGLLLAPVVLTAALASGASQKARYLTEATRLAKQQGRVHPRTLLDRHEVRDGIPLGEERGRRFGVRRGADAGHVLVVAPTRAGKGLHLTGTLETWQGPVVVVDPKREQYLRTSGARAALGPVYCLPQHGLDILDYFNVADVLDLQELFTALLQTWRDHDPIFSQKAYAIFEAARDTMQATGEPMLQILARWAGTAAPEAVREAQRYAPAAMAKFTDGGGADELNRFTLSAWGTFTAKFSTIAPHVATVTQGQIPPTWAEEGASIYICYPLDQLEAAGGLLSVILTALMKGQQRARVKNYTLFAIDELRAASVHALDTKLATVGGYGITILAYLQQLSQLRDVYGPDAAASIIGNFHHQLFYPTRDNESAEYVSQKFGTEVQAIRTYSGDKASYSQRVVAALEPSMVNTLPPTSTVVFTDNSATIAQRVNPFTPGRAPWPEPLAIMVTHAGSTVVYAPDGQVLLRRNPTPATQVAPVIPPSRFAPVPDPVIRVLEPTLEEEQVSKDTEDMDEVYF